MSSFLLQIQFYQRIQNARSMILEDEFTADEFKEIKNDLLNKIEELERKKTKSLPAKDNYLEYLSHGEEIMKNIATRYITASPIGKSKSLVRYYLKTDFPRKSTSNH